MSPNLESNPNSKSLTTEEDIKNKLAAQNQDSNNDSVLSKAIDDADPFRGQGTTYLHLPKIKDNDNNRCNPTGAVVVPISLATTFQQATPGQAMAPDDPNSFGAGYEYSRTGNPTRGAFERAVAAAEHAKYGIAFSSGSAATSAIVHLLNHRDAILCVDDVYGGTQRYFRRIVQPSNGIQVEFCDLSTSLSSSNNEVSNEDHDDDKIPNMNPKTKLIWLETPTNPTLKITDIGRIAQQIKKLNTTRKQRQGENNSSNNDGDDDDDDRNILLAVDNTFCSPYFQTPLEHGADLVVHSVTKYIGGHSDVVMGVICTNDDDLYQRLRFIQNGVGAVPSPFDCFLAHRGLKTLHVRMEAAARNAHAIAIFLEQHDAVAKVLYPGLRSHPQHELAKRQQHGFGAMITFYCAGGREQSSVILQKLKVFALAESLGAVESLAECPSLMTHASVPDDQRAILGIDDNLIRLSVGIESCRDLINDLDGALNAALASIA